MKQKQRDETSFTEGANQNDDSGGELGRRGWGILSAESGELKPPKVGNLGRR